MNTLTPNAAAMVWLAVGIVVLVTLAMLVQDILIERRRQRPTPRWRMVVYSISRFDGTVFYALQKRSLFGWRNYGYTLTRSEAESAINEIVTGVEAKRKGGAK